jgi:hypothetical protein
MEVIEMRSRFYVGQPKFGLRETFSAPTTPTPEDFPRFTYVIGPFRTKAGAEFMRAFGLNNPHVQCVADAERIVKSKGKK